MPRPVINVRRKRHPTTPALVMLNDILANLPLYATGCEPKIVQQLAVPSVHCDFSRSAADDHQQKSEREFAAARTDQFLQQRPRAAQMVAGFTFRLGRRQDIPFSSLDVARFL